MHTTPTQQCGQHTKEIDYGAWPAPRNHMAMKQGYEVSGGHGSSISRHMMIFET